VKSKLAIVIILSGWLLAISYLFNNYLKYRDQIFSQIFSTSQGYDFFFNILIAAIPFITTVIGYLMNERAKLLEGYKESEEKYRDFYQNAPDGYHSIGPDSTILEANDKWLRMLGYKRDEVVGKIKLTGLLTDDGLKSFSDTFSEFKQKGFIENIEYDLKRKDGTTLPVLINDTALYDKDGNFLKSRTIVRDITEMKNKEKKLVESRSAFLNMLRDLDLSYRELKGLYESLIISFVNAIDAKSPWTKGHADRVTHYAMAIAKELGLKEKDMDTLRTAALLHDIGKIGTYEVILDKPERLTIEELDLVKMHPVKGEEILRPISQLKEILSVIRSHHERIDGEGYPDGLKGDEIPFLARIIAVADAFDSMMSDRPYKSKLMEEDAIAELKRCSGTQFDPEIVEAFSRAIVKL